LFAYLASSLSKLVIEHSNIFTEGGIHMHVQASLEV